MDKHIIIIRRGEVERQIEKLQNSLEMLKAELRELDIAEKVFDRLSGAKRGSLGEANEPKPQKPAEASNDGGLTIREMIKEALMDARQQGLPGRTPNQIRMYIKNTHERDVGQQVNTTASRMWRILKEIEKDETSGLFRMPAKEKPVDDKTLAGPSTGFDFGDSRPVEPVPGGGA